MDSSLLEDVAHKQVDVEFMSTIAHQMYVPRHIRLGQNGTEENPTGGVRSAFPAPVDSMNVPQRILVADPFPLLDLTADNENLNERSSPHEIIVDSHNLSHLRNLPITLQTPPSTLTVQNGKYRTAVEELEERHNPKVFPMGDIGLSETSHDITGSVPATGPGSLNADQRIALLERQVTRLNTRVYQLEDELESVQYWQKVQFCLGIAMICIFSLKSIVNR